jgi:hypothetical protein
MPVGNEEILNRFGYHPGTEKTIPQHHKLRDGFIAFAQFLDATLPDGRAKSTAFTKLQESSMWANFGVAEQSSVVSPADEAALLAKIVNFDANVRRSAEEASPDN